MIKRAFVPLLLVVLVLAACGGGGGGGSSGGSSLPAATGGNATNGQKLFTAGKSPAPACNSCHSTQAGTTLVGPPLAHIGTQAGQIVKQSDYKGQAKTPEQYIYESISNPNAYVTPGFQPNVMYQNYAKDLSSQDITDLVAYLMTLK